MEIRSPGLLYGSLTIKRILHEQVSERRNELIAALLQRSHYAETWGRGIPKILQKEPTASFKEVGRQFITVFKRKNVVPEKVPKNTDEKGLKSAEKVPRKVRR